MPPTATTLVQELQGTQETREQASETQIQAPPTTTTETATPLTTYTQMATQAMAAPMPVVMNNHIATSPAAHAPTASGNLVRIGFTYFRWHLSSALLCYIVYCIIAQHGLISLLRSTPSYCNWVEPGKCLPNELKSRHICLSLLSYLLPFNSITHIRASS
jgi:hypothetical protein